MQGNTSRLRSTACGWDKYWGGRRTKKGMPVGEGRWLQRRRARIPGARLLRLQNFVQQCLTFVGSDMELLSCYPSGV